MVSVNNALEDLQSSWYWVFLYDLKEMQQKISIHFTICIYLLFEIRCTLSVWHKLIGFIDQCELRVIQITIRLH